MKPTTVEVSKIYNTHIYKGVEIGLPCGNNASPRHQRITDKKSSSRTGLPLLELLESEGTSK